MNAVSLEPATSDEEERDDEDDFVAGTSFFAEGPRSDERVCASVWNMFVKASNGGGIDPCCVPSITIAALSAVDRGEEVLPPQAAVEGERATMGENGNETKRGALLEQVVEAYKAWKGQNEGEPTAKQLFEMIGESVGKSVGNVYMAFRRARDKGLLGAGSKRMAPKAKRVEEQPKARRPYQRRATSVELGSEKPKASPPPAKGGSLLEQLTAQRDFFADKAAALTSAIEALS